MSQLAGTRKARLAGPAFAAPLPPDADVDAEAWFARHATQESQAYRDAATRMVTALKDAASGNLWNLIGRLQITNPAANVANMDPCLRRSAKSMTRQGTLTWVPGQCIQGDGLTGWLDMNEAWSAESVYGLNGGGLFAFGVTERSPASGNLPHVGDHHATLYRVMGNAANNAANETYRANDASNTQAPQSSSTKGFRLWLRYDASTKKRYRDNILDNTTSQAAVGLSASNGAGLHTGTSYSPDGLAMLGSIGVVTDAQEAELYAIFRAFLVEAGTTL